MLFHSPAFIFGFLPICFLGFVLVHRLWGWDRALLWLAGASLVFYGQWSPALAGLLLGSILFNHGAARLILRNIDQRRRARRLLLGAVAANLALLAYFKYTNFLIDNANLLLGSALPHLDILLPVGISFYSFVQIGFLVEVYNRQVGEIRFGHYLLFGSFFPCVTAGPIILQKDVVPQLAAARAATLDSARIAVALTVFAIGLFKKLILADDIAPFADSVFDGAAAGLPVGPSLAWIGALAYTLQLYFDFSAYSDMALGAAYLFGLRLPLNFNSPLKARSITDFWRRWHMTMTRFFTNYLHAPIAVAMTRRALRRSYGRPARFLLASALPVVATFVLAGLWHGAGWTFVVFGLIHGLALAVNHGWREARLPALPPAAGWLLTMVVVVVGLVFFRAADVPTALTLLASMAGFVLHGASHAGLAAAPIAADAGVALVWILVLGTIALGCPNTQQLMGRHWFSSDPQPEGEEWPFWLTWRPTLAWSVVGAIVLAVALGSFAGQSTFLYYQF
ncbi:MAG TPA: MBOAT family O-acyltransferase [Geminicoccaceae bacterium]|nr:MBOAT family O-acyltransferase [Geminicoccaceae bacterium]